MSVPSGDQEASSSLLPGRRRRAWCQSELRDDVAVRHEHVVITRKGRPAAVVVSPEEWEAVQETLETLQGKETLAALRESEGDVKAGRLFSLDEVRRELGLA